MSAAPRIAVLGAGPAGSVCALSLVAEGVDPRDLVVLDRAVFPRKKLCGGGITYRGTQLLEGLVGRPEGGGDTARLEFVSSLGQFGVREPGPQWVYDRAELDHRLLERVRAAGVEVREGVTVTGIEPGHDALEVRVKGSLGERAERYAWVVGADGATGISRRASGLRGGIMGRLVEGLFERVDAAERSDTLYFDFDPILEGIAGYGWIFPFFTGGALQGFKIGVMDARGDVPGDRLRAFVERWARERGYRPLEPKLSGFPERYWDWSTEGHRPGLVLVGEALGIDRLLGEGIAPSMCSARYAAGRLRAALDAKERTIRGYDRGFLATIEGRNLWFQARLADRIYGAHPTRWLRVLFGMEHLKGLAGRGEDAYGRLVQHMPSLIARYALQVMREGFPSDGPIERVTKGGSLLHQARPLEGASERAPGDEGQSEEEGHARPAIEETDGA